MFSDNGLRYVAMKDSIKMVPFVRDEEELFSNTTARAISKHGFRVVINGQFYSLTQMGVIDALAGSDPVAAKHTTPNGLVVSNKSALSGRSAPQMFYVANQLKEVRRYRFGFGQSPTNVDSAIGGCGPLIINGLKYGVVNKFTNGISGKNFRIGSTGKQDPGIIGCCRR